ncbi:nitroreductase family deazaflavin-dependent oxidoreductase [Williamsia deligens]|uniref:Nitroreductase family deazaflavin-dependent oxidoreductase n=1 Tax=Williamsia deligens TaxID=321325 RepID=A0ABW3G411_9NOCA|nr:nitroreductase family deazaflavin-dependent oxidoreductase [Williamsia deligens]MCP2194353.1 deazaflavin-dependent oxidoreductase, nitroreductase family [Williamsia deligens]
MTSDRKTREKPGALDSPAVGAILKWGSKANTALYKATGGRIGGNWRIGAGFKKPVPVCLLTTTGRKTGEPRTVPLLCLRDGENVVLVASQGGRKNHPLWYLNLVADPDVRIQIGKRTRAYRAHPADDAERTRLWPLMADLYADVDQYQEWADRTIPLVVCVPSD